MATSYNEALAALRRKRPETKSIEYKTSTRVILHDGAGRATMWMFMAGDGFVYQGLWTEHAGWCTHCGQFLNNRPADDLPCVCKGCAKVAAAKAAKEAYAQEEMIGRLEADLAAERRHAAYLERRRAKFEAVVAAAANPLAGGEDEDPCASCTFTIDTCACCGNNW